MQISWDHIRSFQAVASAGSLLAAGRVLGVTQPTVGRHIDLLEDRLGYPLFRRGREGMTLTEKGADLMVAAAEMNGSAEEFARRAAGLEETISGTVRISANEIVGALLVPGLLAELMAAHPTIEVELAVSNALSNLTRRDADIAIRMVRPTQNDLIARKVREVPLGLFAHERYLARHPAPQSPSDLKAHVLLGQDANPSLVEAYTAMGIPVSPTDFAFRCDNNIAIIAAMRAGIGIGPLHIEMAARMPGMVQVLPDLPIPPLELWLACHADVRYNPRIRLVMDTLAARLAAPYDAWEG